MKIELKHLAPYLPYELQLYGASDIWVMRSLGVEEICIANGLHTQTLSFDDCLTDYSPMLRPMSSLTKEVEVNGKKFIPIEEIKESQHHLFFREDIENPLEGVQYLEIQKLFEWHFDVFGLIEVGLAIDINTLSQ